jgi:hypothetical protein
MQPLHHSDLPAPFRFLNEFGYPAGVFVRSVEREPKIRKQVASNSASVISAQTCFQPSSITVPVSRIYA